MGMLMVGISHSQVKLFCFGVIPVSSFSSYRMDSNISKLHIFFFPAMAHGHMIPLVDMAKLFATRGVKATIVTTPLNARRISDTVQRSKDSGLDIHIRTIKFPSLEAGLPEGCEDADSIQRSDFDMVNKFFKASTLFQQPLEQLLKEHKPDCLVADMLFFWATDAGAKFGIPTLVFSVFGYFALCMFECIRLNEPHNKVKSDFEPFIVPNLPGDIKFTRKQLPDFKTQSCETEISKVIKATEESVPKSYGVVVNSFYELEATYAEHYMNFFGIKSWHIGPISLCINHTIEDKADRGKKALIDEHECLKWLDSKKSNSVVYVCFGSLALFDAVQLKEIAVGIEGSGQEFIWVVPNLENNEGEDDLLEFEKRMEGKGLIIRGWAPQLLILEHEAVGGFVTHCGWNSTLEAVAAGLPMVTWPLESEQFYNEKLVTEVLKIGVGVGVKEWVRVVGDFVKREAIENAVKEIMVGERAEGMRSRARALGDLAKRAVERGGSSYHNLSCLIQELLSLPRG